MSPAMRRLRSSSMAISVAVLSCALVGSSTLVASAAASKPSTINVDNLVLPDGITAVMIGDYSKAPDPKTDGTKQYSCLAIYLVSSLPTSTTVHVSGLTVAASEAGTNILYGGALSGYLTVRGNTAESEYLPSSQALGRLSPAGTFSDPYKLRNPSVAAIPDVLNCQTPSIGRMFGLTVARSDNYLTNKTLYVSGQVDTATASTYDVTSVTVPAKYKPVINYKTSDGYLSSCITRDGRSTIIGVALRQTGKFVRYAVAGKYIARNVTIDGVEYPTPGIPNFRSTCVPVAIVPNDDLGDITGDRSMFITANIVPWAGQIVNRISVTGATKLAKVQLGAVDSDTVAVTYNPTVNKSFIWLTAKSRGSLAKCTGTTFSFSGLVSSYVADGVTSRGVALVTTTTAKKYAAIKTSSGGADTYAVMSLAGNVFASDGKLTLSGSVVATDKCTP